MQKKAIPLINQGMNRDLSISKTGESNAYENRNIRILARENSTQISVTNERGTKQITLCPEGRVTRRMLRSMLRSASPDVVWVPSESGTGPSLGAFVDSRDHSGSEWTIGGSITVCFNFVNTAPSSYQFQTGSQNRPGADGWGAVYFYQAIGYDGNDNKIVASPTQVVSYWIKNFTAAELASFANYSGDSLNTSLVGVDDSEVFYVSETASTSATRIREEPLSFSLTATGLQRIDILVHAFRFQVERVTENLISYGDGDNNVPMLYRLINTMTEVAPVTSYAVVNSVIDDDVQPDPEPEPDPDPDPEPEPGPDPEPDPEPEYDGSISGILIGWNVLNNHIVLFTTESGTDTRSVSEKPDHIYRVDYHVDGSKDEDGNVYDDEQFDIFHLFNGDLGFDVKHPIESIVYYESEDVQKIYWLDGINVLRMMNFMADDDEQAMWYDGDDNYSGYFDSNRIVHFTGTATIEKDNSGNTRDNGTIQYMLTYFNKHGQESGCAWVSDLVYLSPYGRGGAPDEYNNNRVKITFSNLDDSYTNFRVYSVFRSSYDGTPVAYIVANNEIPESRTATVVDDNSHLEAVDASSLLFLGSMNVKPSTMTHKDQTLFLGDLSSIGKSSYSDFEALLRDEMMKHAVGDTYFSGDWEIKDEYFSFDYSDSNDSSHEIDDIPYVERAGLYPYNNQLELTSSEIRTFKGGEKYRFALSFRDKNGVMTDAFWIGDKENELYPMINIVGKCIKRIVAKVTIPSSVISAARNAGFSVVQLMIAEAGYADRSVKAQGILNPTVFNVWERYNNRLYASPSWISRPRDAMFPSMHFQSLNNSTVSTGELECNYWKTDNAPKPYYRIKNYGEADMSYEEDVPRLVSYDYHMTILAGERIGTYFRFAVKAYYIELTAPTSYAFDEACDFLFAQHQDLFNSGNDTEPRTFSNADTEQDPNHIFSGIVKNTIIFDSGWGSGQSEENNRKVLTSRLHDAMVNELGVPDLKGYVPRREDVDLVLNYCLNFDGWHHMNLTLSKYQLMRDYAWDAADAFPQDGDTASRWYSESNGNPDGVVGSYIPSYYKQQYYFLDENTVTFDSPEIEYEAVSLDGVSGHKLRIVGVAKMSSCISDYTVNASHAKLAGENLVNINFSGSIGEDNIDGLVSWPLWDEIGLRIDPDSETPLPSEDDETGYVPSNYKKTGSIVRYWLHMWNHSGNIDGFDLDGDQYSYLHSKTFANYRFSYNTVFNTDRQKDWVSGYDSLRIFNYSSSQYVGIKVNGNTRYYNGVVDTLVSCPRDFKYPILYSYPGSVGDDSNILESNNKYLYSDSPIPLTYSSGFHAVLSLPSEIDAISGEYTQTVLPYVRPKEEYSMPERISVGTLEDPNTYTGALIPWEDINAPKYNCVVGNIPNGFKVVYYNAYTGKSTLEYQSAEPIMYSSFYADTWLPGLEYFGSDKVYARIRVVEDHDPNYYAIYLVNIANHELVSSHILRITDAEVIAAFYVDGEDSFVYANYFKNAAGDLAPETGFKKLSIETGTLTDVDGYLYSDYKVDLTRFEIDEGVAEPVRDSDEYLLVGEIFIDYHDGQTVDNRYGGITLDDVEKNRFVIAGPQYMIPDSDTDLDIVGNQGDTYFQRWDDFRIKPYSDNQTNNVSDIVSVMLETHINIDGRYDKLRGISKIASVIPADFGPLNRAYSQPNNFFVARDNDEDMNTDTFRHAITWTLEKHDLAEVDEWMHITLGSSLKLDGDKGPCNALCRIGNGIVAFQDKGISEILFNSRTQIPTSEGVPIEIANSGKVDGKRYITNKFGCTNKWSIVEGKDALYFVDNINKAFCAFDGQSVVNLSENLGFSAYFKKENEVLPWNPADFNNIVSYYDRIHSDVYLMMDSESLVYSEPLKRFTSFFDYASVPMMTNVYDRFISFYNQKLWLQNEGFFCDFFGVDKPFYVEYRPTPDPFGDKIWTNVEYRADFYNILNSDNAKMLASEDKIISDERYLPNETFDSLTVWNEYQTTNDATIPKPLVDRYYDTRKKFRIWRMDIPRAVATASNKYGFDRIRNPWVHIRFKKNVPATAGANKTNMVQVHDFSVIYYE